MKFKGFRTIEGFGTLIFKRKISKPFIEAVKVIVPF